MSELTLSKEDQQIFYNEILRIYDFAQDIIEVIEKTSGKHAELHTKLVIPILRQVEETTAILAQNYLEFVKEGQKISVVKKKETEVALRKLFNTFIVFLSDIKKSVGEKGRV